MYCVIQEIELKRQNTYGEYKELKVNSTSRTDYTTGETQTWYSYTYSNDRFERPIKKAYKISIHHSYREYGKVKKKQWSVCTMSYYDVIESSLYDCATGRIERLSEQLNIDQETIYNLIHSKLEPLIKQIEEEFKQTAEHTIKTAHDITIKEYLREKSEFENIYGTSTYNYCYDVFGEIRNKEMLNNIKRQYEAAQKQKRGYYENYQSNYNSNSNSSGYSTIKQSNYTDKEKEYLKKIYRAAAMKLHPDITGDNEGMQFLNTLKEQWGIQ